MLDDNTILEELGLTPNEVRVYLASLTLGSSSAHDIAVKCGLLRTSTYEILKSLSHKGIVSSIVKGKVKYFEATNPQRFVKILDERKDRLLHVLPHLLKIRGSIVEKPSVEFYEGKDGLKTILGDVLRHCTLKYRVVGNNTKFQSFIPEYARKAFLRKRLAANVVVERIAEDSPLTREKHARDLEERRVTKILSGLSKANAELFIYSDRIALFTLVDNHAVGIVVKEKNIADFFDILFQELWDRKKK